MLNEGCEYVSVIGAEQQGRTLLTHLVTEYPHSSLEEWRQRLDDGEFTMDGVRATGCEELRAGQRLVRTRPPWVEPEAPRRFEILFEDDHLLAVSKPGGLPTLPGGGFLENTLLRLVRSHAPEANPVHRLGRGTSGIVLFAKKADAASRLCSDWNTDAVQKVYRALSDGIAALDLYEIRTRIGLVPHPRLGSVWAADESGKRALSVARVIARGSERTTFEVSLGSGRPHQIRIHLASIGHPLAGDPLYASGGGPLEHLPGLPGDGGYLLHAHYLRFRHPVTGEAMRLEASLPAGF